MTIPLWIYLGLAAQLLWVTGAIIDKFLIAKYFPTEEDKSNVGVLILFSAVFSIGISIVAIVLGFDGIEFSLKAGLSGILIGFANALWVIMYLYAIEDTELSRTIPLFQTTPIFGFILGWLFLSETLATGQILGSLTIITGAFVLSYQFSNKSFTWKPVLLMLGASAIIAFQETYFKVQTIEYSYWHSAFWLGLGFTLFGALIYLTKKSYRQQFHETIFSGGKGVWLVNGTNELIDNTANLISAFAITLGPIALVQSINAYQPLLMLLTSYFVFITFGDFLDEDISKQTIIQKFLGVLIITIGSALLYLSL